MLERVTFTPLSRAWTQIWFKRRPTAPLELTRIGLGAALLVHYGLAIPYLFTLWGDAGWFPRSTISTNITDPLIQSVFFYFTAPWQWIAFHIIFLFCCAALTVGWRTSWVKWVVWVGQISFAHRSPDLTYGVDAILASLLFLLCLAPIGRAMSLDRVRAVHRAKRSNLGDRPPPYFSSWAFACTRLMQIQMAIVFFFSAAHKIKGSEWWYGDAIWIVFKTSDYYSSAMLDLLASQFWLVNVATYSMILVEVAFPFLIWQQRTRPYLLAAAIFLHFLFFVFLGLFYFSFVMVMGHLSFVRIEWLERLGAAWKRRMGEVEMIYDGNCGFCVKSMAWFLSFDGLEQIKIRNFRTNPSPIVSDAQMEKALYLVAPDGRALPGFEAYRYVVLRVPGLWWQVPVFYVPVISRLLGHAIYNWIAANRSRL